VMVVGMSTGDRIIRKMMMGRNMVSPTFLREAERLDGCGSWQFEPRRRVRHET
jgi:hypothetical protein